MSESNYISIKGAKVNNLKNIDVNIPRNKLVVRKPVIIRPSISGPHEQA